MVFFIINKGEIIVMVDKKETTEILYHYCGVEAFLNIIENSKLWLSDYKKLNDSKEGTWIRDKINEEVKNRLKEYDKKRLKAWIDWVDVNLNMNTSLKTYISCFSEQKDCLSLWRGYAQDGQGLSIGISKKKLQELYHPYSLKFDKAIYKEQDEFIRKITEEIISGMSSKGVGHSALELNSNNNLEFPFYKNPSFGDEKEWRVILLSKPTRSERINKKDFCFLPPKYRINNGNIISYCEMDFSKTKNDFIKEIWIGPKSKVTETDVIDLLEVANYYNDEEHNSDKPIIIQHSKSSYR